MNIFRRLIARHNIEAASKTSKALGYRALSGHIASLVATGRLIRVSDFLDRVGGGDIKDGYQSWYGRHAKKAYMAATGTEPVRVWAQHRRTGRWNHVYAYAPDDTALTEGLRSYKQTRQFAVQGEFVQAA